MLFESYKLAKVSSECPRKTRYPWLQA